MVKNELVSTKARLRVLRWRNSHSLSITTTFFLSPQKKLYKAHTMRLSPIGPQSTIIFLLIISAPLVTLAYDASQRSCVGDNVCLTSFHWCAAQDLRGDGQTGCSFPDDAYPMTLNENKQNAALLIRGHDYVISWKKGDPTNLNPVKITWMFGGGDGVDESI